MTSRLMINLRDPTLHKPVDSDGIVTASRPRPISTAVLEDTFITMGVEMENLKANK